MVFALIACLLSGPVIEYREAYERSEITGVIVVLLTGKHCVHCDRQEHVFNSIPVDFHKTIEADRFKAAFGKKDIPATRPITLVYWDTEGEWKVKPFLGFIERPVMEAFIRARQR